MTGLKHIFQKNKFIDILRKPIVTKEHGSWAILLVPAITGISASVNHNLNAIILSLICILFLFMSYVPAEVVLNRRLKNYPANQNYYISLFWLAVYLIISCICGAFLVFYFNRPMLLYIAVAAFIIFNESMLLANKTKKNVWSDLLAVTGLTLSAPALIYILDGNITMNNLVAWLLNILFFGSSTVYVHMKIRAASVKKDNLSLPERISLGKINLIYHLIIISLLIFYTYMFPAREIIVFAFIPTVVHAIIGTFKYAKKTNFKKLGYTLLAYSILFAILFLISV